MTKQEFLDKLNQRLLAGGLTKEASDQKCAGISRGLSKLSEDDARRYFTEANVSMIADRLIREAGSNDLNPDSTQGKEQPEPPKAQAQEQPVQPEKPVKTEKPGDVAQTGKPDNRKNVDSTPAPTIVIPKSKGNTPSGRDSGKQDSDIAKVSASDDVVFIHPTPSKGGTGKHGLRVTIDESVMSQDSKNPKLLLAAIIALCAPMFIFLVVGVLGLSLGIALAMASVILAVVCIIAVIVCAGSALSAMSLIYGITQIISEPRYVGLHEIGLAMVFAGLTILVSVLLYNVAVRLIPLLYRLIGKGLKVLYQKTKQLCIAVWKGCKSL